MTTESITRKIFVMWGTQNSQDSRPHCTDPQISLIYIPQNLTGPEPSHNSRN